MGMRLISMMFTDFIIKSAVEQLGINCRRCDEIAEAGWIHSKMFHQIYNAPIAIADITSLA